MTTFGRDHTGRYTRTLAGAARDAEACRLRASGASYERIATELGYASRSNARRAVSNALVETLQEPADEVRQLALLELDELAREAWRVLRTAHVMVAHGRVVKRDGEPIPDDGPVLQAIDRLLKVNESRRKLLGLDAPARHEVQSISAIDAQIAKLEAELAGCDVGGCDD